MGPKTSNTREPLTKKNSYQELSKWESSKLSTTQKTKIASEYLALQRNEKTANEAMKSAFDDLVKIRDGKPQNAVKEPAVLKKNIPPSAFSTEDKGNDAQIVKQQSKTESNVKSDQDEESSSSKELLEEEDSSEELDRGAPVAKDNTINKPSRSGVEHTGNINVNKHGEFKKDPIDRLMINLKTFSKQTALGAHDKEIVKTKIQEFLKAYAGIIKSEGAIPVDKRNEIKHEIKDLPNKYKEGKLFKKSILEEINNVIDQPSVKYKSCINPWKSHNQDLQLFFSSANMNQNTEVELTLNRKSEKVKMSELLSGEDKSVFKIIENSLSKSQQPSSDYSSFITGALNRLEEGKRALSKENIVQDVSNLFLDVNNAQQEACKSLEKVLNKFCDDNVASLVLLDSEGAEAFKPEQQAWNSLLKQQLETIPGMENFVDKRLALNKRFFDIAKSQGKKLDANELESLLNDVLEFNKTYAPVFKKNHDQLQLLKDAMGTALPRFYTTGHPDFPGMVFKDNEAKVDDQTLTSLKDDFKKQTNKSPDENRNSFALFLRNKGYQCDDNAFVIWQKKSAVSPDAISRAKDYQILLENYIPSKIPPDTAKSNAKDIRELLNHAQKALKMIGEAKTSNLFWENKLKEFSKEQQEGFKQELKNPKASLGQNPYHITSNNELKIKNNTQILAIQEPKLRQITQNYNGNDWELIDKYNKEAYVHYLPDTLSAEFKVYTKMLQTFNDQQITDQKKAEVLSKYEIRKPSEFLGDITSAFTAAISPGAPLFTLVERNTVDNVLKRVERFIDPNKTEDINKIAKMRDSFNKLSDEIDSLVTSLTSNKNLKVYKSFGGAKELNENFRLDQKQDKQLEEAIKVFDTISNEISNISGIPSLPDQKDSTNPLNFLVLLQKNTQAKIRAAKLSAIEIREKCKPT